MRERCTTNWFLKKILAVFIPVLPLMLSASAVWATPTVTSVDINPPLSTAISATFSEPMDPASITNGSFKVSKSVKIKAISAGGNHSLVLKDDGTVAAWGDNDYGQCAVPEGLSGVIAISAGMVHSVALKNDGTVVAWGAAAYPLNYGQATVPEGLSGIIAIDAGGYHTVALKSDGTVVAWGDNSHGQTTIPEGLSGVIAISAGALHSVALKNDGTVIAWGYNYDGEATVPEGLSGVIAISAGSWHNLALKSDGTVAFWGLNPYNWLNVPVGLSDVVSISAGHMHSVALKSDGTFVAWGEKDYRAIFLPAGVSGIIAAEAGAYFTVVLKNDGTVFDWVYNGYNGVGKTTVPVSINDSIVPGSVFYDQATNTASFTPSVPLEPGVSYFGTVTTGVLSAMGDALATDVRWNFSLGQANATITLAGLNQEYDGTSKAVTATTIPSGLAVSITYNGSFTVPTAIGNYAVVATINEPNYQGAVSGTLNITKTTAYITLGNLTQTFDGTSKAVSVSTTPASLAVDITYNGSTTVPTSAGSYVVVATINDLIYQGISNNTMDIVKADQTISFTAPVTALKKDIITLNATSSSGLPVVFAVASGHGTIVGSTLSFTGTGDVVITASQPGNNNFNAAPVIQGTIKVTAK